jgi:hypothetical protein
MSIDYSDLSQADEVELSFDLPSTACVLFKGFDLMVTDGGM